MNAKQRRKLRRKAQADEIKKAYAWSEGKVEEVEMLDKTYSFEKRDPVIIDEGGNIIPEPKLEPKMHPGFQNLAKAALWQIFHPR